MRWKLENSLDERRTRNKVQGSDSTRVRRRAACKRAAGILAIPLPTGVESRLKPLVVLCHSGPWLLADLSFAVTAIFHLLHAPMRATMHAPT